MVKCLSLFFIIQLVAACQAPLLQDKDLLDLDYYFGQDFIQIQGHAKLPSSVKIVKTKEKESKIFLTFGERRQVCLKLALLNAHSKWLGITDKKWLPQSEWLLRMKLGEISSWNSCLSESRQINHFYDLPGKCRLLVRYKCDPRDY